jgi:hypothetical protein
LEIERLVGDDPLQPAILVLEALESMELGAVHTAALPLPAIQRVEGSAVPANHLIRGDIPGVRFQDRSDLNRGMATSTAARTVLWPSGRQGPYDSSWTSSRA